MSKKKIITGIATGCLLAALAVVPMGDRAINADYQPNAIVSIAEAAKVTQFHDWGKGDTWPGHGWLDENEQDRNNIKKAVEQGIYNGYPDKYLRLTNTITRWEFGVALARTAGYGSNDNDRITALTDAGVITKQGDINKAITREEMGQWVGKVVKQRNIKYGTAKFSDTKDSDILAAAGAEVIQGYPDGSFGLDKTAWRAHAALMLVRLHDQMPANYEVIMPKPKPEPVQPTIPYDPNKPQALNDIQNIIGAEIEPSKRVDGLYNYYGSKDGRNFSIQYEHNKNSNDKVTLLVSDKTTIENTSEIAKIINHYFPSHSREIIDKLNNCMTTRNTEPSQGNYNNHSIVIRHNGSDTVALTIK